MLHTNYTISPKMHLPKSWVKLLKIGEKIMSISITAGHIIARVKNTPLEELSEFFLEAKGDALYIRKDLIARLNERILEATGKELTRVEIHLLDKFYQTSTINIPLLQVLDILRNDISELPVEIQNLANYCVNDKYEWKFLSFDELKKFSKYFCLVTHLTGAQGP